MRFGSGVSHRGQWSGHIILLVLAPHYFALLSVSFYFSTFAPLFLPFTLLTMSINAILLSLLLIAPWPMLVFSSQPPPTFQRQHIAILDSSVDTSFLSSLSKRGDRDYKVLSFDDQTHILLGNFPQQHHKRQNGWMSVEPNQEVAIAGSSTRATFNTTSTGGYNTTVPGPYAIQMDVPSWVKHPPRSAWSLIVSPYISF